MSHPVMHACVDDFIKDKCVAWSWDGGVDGAIGFISRANYEGGLCTMKFRNLLFNLLNIIVVLIHQAGISTVEREVGMLSKLFEKRRAHLFSGP